MQNHNFDSYSIPGNNTISKSNLRIVHTSTLLTTAAVEQWPDTLIHIKLVRKYVTQSDCNAKIMSLIRVCWKCK